MPRFPFRRSVGQDLRDLFAHDRLQRQANDLGYSSLSPGEGSFDILDGNGNVVAVYGHAADKAGFLVPDGAGWQTVGEAADAAIAAATGPLVTRLDSHASRIGAAENDITAIESLNTTQNSRLDSHASRIGAAEGDIADHTSRLDAHAIRHGRNENEIQKLIDYINALNTRVSELEGDGVKPGLPDNPKG